jgi:hypothetical protein
MGTVFCSCVAAELAHVVAQEDCSSTAKALVNRKSLRRKESWTSQLSRNRALQDFLHCIVLVRERKDTGNNAQLLPLEPERLII